MLIFTLHYLKNHYPFLRTIISVTAKSIQIQLLPDRIFKSALNWNENRRQNGRKTATFTSTSNAFSFLPIFPDDDPHIFVDSFNFIPPPSTFKMSPTTGIAIATWICYEIRPYYIRSRKVKRTRISKKTPGPGPTEGCRQIVDGSKGVHQLRFSWTNFKQAISLLLSLCHGAIFNIPEDVFLVDSSSCWSSLLSVGLSVCMRPLSKDPWR